jgi:hypothetical protein
VSEQSISEACRIVGTVIFELSDSRGNLLARCEVNNLVTQVGDQMYFERAAAISGAPAAPTGLRLGTGANTGGNAPAKTGAGAALTTYLSGSNKAFDSTWPQSSLTGSARRIQYKATYGAGVATTPSPITEAVIVNDTIATDATSSAANTITRVAVPGIPSKGATDVLTVTWNHDLSS